MTTRKRKGLLIKNTNAQPVTIEMKTRTIVLHNGDEALVTAEEVRDDALRLLLQVRGVSIVRPSTDEEEDTLRQQLAGESNPF